MRGVRQNRFVCPISDVLFLELLKQADPQTRLATAELIDELSCGVTLISHQERVATEIAHFLYAQSGNTVHDLELLSWSKVSYILGVQHSVMAAFPVEEQLVMQKAFFDHMWEISLSKMAEILSNALFPDAMYSGDFAASLNESNTRHAMEMRSFEQVYKDEIYGVLEIAVPIARDVLEGMFLKSTGQAIEHSANVQESEIQAIYNLLCAAVSKQSVRRALRTLHISALLHTAVRWNRTQKIVANDLYDFHHAEAALGYCDMFFTDKPMHSLLVQRHLSIEKDFSCRITSSRQVAAAWVQW